jgi:hypothetical protein
VSKRINVNPDHYKVAGRERPGDATAAKARTMRESLTKKWTRVQNKKRDR